MPVKKLSEAMLKKLKKHSDDHGGKAHMNAMKKLMEEPPYPSMKKAHDMLMKKKKPMKKQTKKDRLDEAEGKSKGMKKKKQGTQARLDEAEGKKKGMKPMLKKKKTTTKY